MMAAARQLELCHKTTPRLWRSAGKVLNVCSPEESSAIRATKL
jgi:hypothetical protein